MVNFEYLRRNSEAFLKNAKHLYSIGEYNLAAFNLEQAVQPLLKYILAMKFGDFPRTHSVKILIEEAGKECPAVREIFRENPNAIGNLEAAYIMARYMPAHFSKEELEELMRITTRLWEVLIYCLS